MSVPLPYYEIVAGGRPFLLPAGAVVGNLERREAEMISEDEERPVGWLTLAYRRVPIFSLGNAAPGRARNWTRALVIQVEGGDPVGLAVEAARPLETDGGSPVEISIPGNRLPGGCLFTQALLEGERLRLIFSPERLSAHLHRRPRL
jgi:hypothetical protein